MAATILIYDYVEDVLERRAPHREAHLAHLETWRERGSLRVAGVFGDPPDGALFVFEGVEPAQVEEFAVADPYVEAGLVASSRIEPLGLVVRERLD